MDARLLADELGGRHRSWQPWLWWIPAVLALGGTVLALFILVGWLVDHEAVSSIPVWHAMALDGALVFISTLVFWTGCRWMRALGLRLYRMS